MPLIEHAERLLWGRTRREAMEQSRAENVARWERFFAENADADGCYIVHAPEIWGGYCEIHKRPVYEGHPCEGR